MLLADFELAVLTLLVFLRQHIAKLQKKEGIPTTVASGNSTPSGSAKKAAPGSKRKASAKKGKKIEPEIDDDDDNDFEVEETPTKKPKYQ